MLITDIGMMLDSSAYNKDNVSFATWGKILLEWFLPSDEHDWLMWLHDNFGMHERFLERDVCGGSVRDAWMTCLSIFQCWQAFSNSNFLSAVASSQFALCWMCDSPWTECARRITPMYMWHEQAIMEWSRQVISIVACIVVPVWWTNVGFPWFGNLCWGLGCCPA